MTRQAQPKISIIIRCFNEEKNIGRLLMGILEQTIKDIQIILVDSGSTDSTLSIASRFPVEIVSIHPDDFSFGYSLNVGCSRAEGKYIVVASAHVYPVYQDWLEQLIAPLNDEHIAISYGKQRGNNFTKYSEHQVFAKWFPEQSKANQKIQFCNNANAVICRDLWESFPYDENLTGLEDLAWAKRIKANGYKIAYKAEAEVIHVHNETYKRIYNRYRREAIAYKQIFPHEHFNLIDFIRLFGQNVVSDLYHALNDGVIWSQLKSILAFRLVQFWGTYKGFNMHGAVSGDLKHTFYYPNEYKHRPNDIEQPERKKRVIDYSELHRKEISNGIH